MRIAALRPGDILGQLDDPVADRLVAAAGQRHAHQMLVNESFRHAVGFDNFLPHFRFERRKPFRGLLGILLGQVFGHIVHRFAHPVSGLEVGKLAQDVGRRNAGQIRGFRMAESGSQVAGSASEHTSIGPARDHPRHRRVLIGKPVRRILDVVNLILSVDFGAARDMNRPAPVIQNGLNFIPYRKRPRNIREMPWLRGLSCDPQKGDKCKRQGANKNPGESPRGSSRDARTQPVEMPMPLPFRVMCFLVRIS